MPCVHVRSSADRTTNRHNTINTTLGAPEITTNVMVLPPSRRSHGGWAERRMCRTTLATALQGTGHALSLGQKPVASLHGVLRHRLPTRSLTMPVTPSVATVAPTAVARDREMPDSRPTLARSIPRCKAVAVLRRSRPLLAVAVLATNPNGHRAEAGPEGSWSGETQSKLEGSKLTLLRATWSLCCCCGLSHMHVVGRRAVRAWDSSTMHAHVRAMSRSPWYFERGVM